MISASRALPVLRYVYVMLSRSVHTALPRPWIISITVNTIVASQISVGQH